MQMWRQSRPKNEIATLPASPSAGREQAGTRNDNYFFNLNKSLISFKLPQG